MSESRSTSAGSRDSGRCYGSTIDQRLPEYDYPVPVVIRNTFLDAKVGRPESLDEFFEQRRIQSCPGTAGPADHPLQDNYDAVLNSPEPSFLHNAFSVGAQAFMDKIVAATGFWTEPQCEVISNDPYNIAQMPRVLVLSEALPQVGGETGMQDLPTMGSAGHNAGTCKPCAFLYTKGCENGTQCQFCHLCPPDAKKRRQKEKQAAFREARRQRRQMQV